MSEDEAFIRAVVSAPGDDLPRLVYADWLDERSDPRGAYLRAEAEWAKTKQTTGFLVLRLHGLAEGLDPVWVARVSRPPEGVCCDHLSFRDCGPFLTHKNVDEIDRWPGVKLPPAYKALLLNHNGGFAVGRGGSKNSESDGDIEGVFFLPVIPPGDPRQRRTLHGDGQYYWDRVIPDWLDGVEDVENSEMGKFYSEVIPIGSHGYFDGLILLGVRTLHHPKVLLDRGDMAVDFTTFLARITGEPALFDSP